METLYTYLTYAALLGGTILIFIISKWIFMKLRVSFAHPLLLATTTVITLLILLDIPYPTYKTATLPIESLLGPTVVALGYLLYEHRENLRRHALSILISTTVGSIIGIASVWATFQLFDTPWEIIVSIMPKSVTNPIAMPLTEAAGGIVSLTAVIVVLTGIFGAVVSPALLKLFRIDEPIAMGLSMGAAAHGIGTARAVEMGSLHGAIAGLAIALMGLITALIISIIL